MKMVWISVVASVVAGVIIGIVALAWGEELYWRFLNQVSKKANLGLIASGSPGWVSLDLCHHSLG